MSHSSIKETRGHVCVSTMLAMVYERVTREGRLSRINLNVWNTSQWKLNRSRKQTAKRFSRQFLFPNDFIFSSQVQIRESWFIFQTNDQLCRTHVCALSIYRTFYYRYIYIYMYTYRRQSILECRNQQTVRNKIRNMQWLIIIPLNKITIRT